MHNLLILDNAPLRRSLLLALLSDERFNVRLVETREQALAALRSRPADLLLAGAASVASDSDVFFSRAQGACGDRFHVLILRSGPEQAPVVVGASVVRFPCPREQFLTAVENALAGEIVVVTDDALAGRNPFAKSMAELFAKLAELDHYQLLEVEQDADRATILKAYRRRSVELHPDRVSYVDDEMLKQQVTIIVKQLNLAFQTLTNPVLRQAYDRTTTTGVTERAPIDPASLGVKTTPGLRYAELALQSEQRGDLHAALNYLEMAAQEEHDPPQPLVDRIKALRDRLIPTPAA